MAYRNTLSAVYGTGIKRPRRDEGVALILALLFIVLLSVLVVDFSYEMQVEASFAMNQGNDLEAFLAAKSAVAKGIAVLAEDLLDEEIQGTPPVDSMLDGVPWALPQPFEPMNEALMRTSTADEYGKINLNALVDNSQGAPEVREELRAALVEFFTLRDPQSRVPPETIVDAIVDWLDYDDDDATEPDGAENDYYLGLENPYPCKNGPMDSIEELLLIKGITPELYFGDPKQEDQLPLPEYLTVHGDWQGRVNANTALPETLAAMIAGFTDGTADLAVADQIYEDARAQPFSNVSELNQYVGGLGSTQRQRVDPTTGRPLARDPALPDGPDSLEEERTPFMVRSNVFRIYGDGMLDDVLVRIEAYVWRTPLDLSEFDNTLTPDGAPLPIPEEPFRILSWKVIR